MITVYSRVVIADGHPLVRMALHPVLDDRAHYVRHADAHPLDCMPYPCRVVWCWELDLDVYDDPWRASCPTRGGDWKGQPYMTDAQAIAWLLRGER